MALNTAYIPMRSRVSRAKNSATTRRRHEERRVDDGVERRPLLLDPRQRIHGDGAGHGVGRPAGGHVDGGRHPRGVGAGSGRDRQHLVGAGCQHQVGPGRGQHGPPGLDVAP